MCKISLISVFKHSFDGSSVLEADLRAFGQPSGWQLEHIKTTLDSSQDRGTRVYHISELGGTLDIHQPSFLTLPAPDEGFVVKLKA